MEKFIPYEKLSKKEKRKLDLSRRQTWGELNPVTRKPVSSKAYNRKKSQDWKREPPPKTCDFSFLLHNLLRDSSHPLGSLRKLLLGKAPKKEVYEHRNRIHCEYCPGDDADYLQPFLCFLLVFRCHN